MGTRNKNYVLKFTVEVLLTFLYVAGMQHGDTNG